jgi:hypothetical protein
LLDLGHDSDGMTAVGMTVPKPPFKPPAWVRLGMTVPKPPFKPPAGVRLGGA